MGEGDSNMAIVDIEIPSGYQYTSHEKEKGIERVDVRGSNIVIYLSGVSVSIYS